MKEYRPAWRLEDGKVRRSDYMMDFDHDLHGLDKRRNIHNLHDAIGEDALEISTKSESQLGQGLSAFNLHLDGKILECVYQASKVYEKGGPYLDLIDLDPRVVKKDERLTESGEITHYLYKGKSYGPDLGMLFYDYLYYQAVKESFDVETLKEILRYNHFTDIEFRPNGFNTQARAIVLVKKLLEETGELPDMDFEEFRTFHDGTIEG